MYGVLIIYNEFKRIVGTYSIHGASGMYDYIFFKYTYIYIHIEINKQINIYIYICIFVYFGGYDRFR